MRGAILLLLLYAFMAWAGITSLFTALGELSPLKDECKAINVKFCKF
jgi:hypothetical protein